MPKSASRDTPLAHGSTAKWDTNRARENFSCSRTLMEKKFTKFAGNYQNKFKIYFGYAFNEKIFS